MMETTVRKFNFDQAQLDATAPDHAEQAAQLAAEKLAYQTADCLKRMEKYPTDLTIQIGRAHV